MKKNSTLISCFALFIALLWMTASHAQFVGIGTTNPDYKLHVAGNTAAILKLENVSPLNGGIPTDLYFKTGNYFTGGIKTIGTANNAARLGFFTYASSNHSQLVERLSIVDNGNVGIGITTPQYPLEVNGRVRLRHNGGTSGIYFMDAANANNRGFIGMKDDQSIGFFGGNGAGWGLTMSTSTGNVDMLGLLSVFNRVYVTTSGAYAAQFINNSVTGNPAVIAESDIVAGQGTGVAGYGGETGLYGIANKAGGTNHRYGVEGYGQNGPANNYGVYASGSGGNNAIGIYATASSGSTNWGGYFSGSVYTTGSYQSSDRKLKNNIQPLQHAMQLIKALKPATYTYKTDEFAQMMLPEGTQFGLIADEVKQVFPDMVKKTVQPAMYENDDHRSGRMVAEEVTFDAVNYTAMIPVLIAAMQEQQTMIETLQQKILELEVRLK